LHGPIFEKERGKYAYYFDIIEEFISQPRYEVICKCEDDNPNIYGD
jgi:hypothetical protein